MRLFNFYQNYSLQLEPLGAYKIVIFRSIRLKLTSLNQELYIDLKKLSQSLNPITNESVDHCSPFFRHPEYKVGTGRRL